MLQQDDALFTPSSSPSKNYPPSVEKEETVPAQQREAEKSSGTEKPTTKPQRAFTSAL